MPVLCIPYEVTTKKDGTNSATEIRASYFPRNSASIQAMDTVTVFVKCQVSRKRTSYYHFFNLVITISSILSMIVPLVSTKTGSGNSESELSDALLKTSILDLPKRTKT